MRFNKKTILISWFIGLGSGLFLSGIILSVLMYTTNKTLTTPEIPIEEVQIEEMQIENQAEEEPKEEKKQEEEQKTNEEDEQAPETIELEIKPTSTAREITRLLVDNGVILDYDEFIEYIVLQDAERSLSHGIKTFPLDSDIETVFKILRP